MRLTFCTTDGWNACGGVNTRLLRFLPALRARGHDARVLLFPWSRPERCVTLPQLRASGVPVDVVYPPRYTEDAVRACLDHSRRFAPDIFIANMVTSALHAAGWLRSSGIPTVGVLHNDDGEYRAKAELFAGADPFFRVSALVAISRGLLRLAEPAPAGLAVRCIPYGVALPAVRAHWDGRSVLRLVYHGRIVVEQKRILETAAACVRIARATGRVEADFYGAGPAEADLVALLARDDGGGRVRFLGPVDSARVPEMLGAYHVAVLLSDYEGLGLSVLEGMASGLVPVCHRTASGLPDLVSHGENGFFVDDRNASFDAAIQRLLDEPGTWNRLAHNARATAERDFSVESSLAAWEELFATLAASVRPHTRVPRLWRVPLHPVHPALRGEDHRYPGFARAVWRRLRFPRRA